MECNRSCPVVKFGLVPALISVPLTALRAWMELNHPDSAKFVAVFPASAVWVLVMAICLLARGDSFKALLKTASVFALVNRGAMGVAYALAWAGQWKTPAGANVRYVEQVLEVLKKQGVDADGYASWKVFCFFTIFPLAIHVVAAVLFWFIGWAIAFRGKRPAVAGAATSCATQ